MSKEFLLKTISWLREQSPLILPAEALSTHGCLEAPAMPEQGGLGRRAGSCRTLSQALHWIIHGNFPAQTASHFYVTISCDYIFNLLPVGMSYISHFLKF